MSQRVLPQADQAEREVLGSCLMSANALEAALEVLSPDQFFNPSHQRLFTVMRHLHGSGEPVDALTVYRELERRHWEQNIKGGDAAPYLADLIGSCNTMQPERTKRHAEIIKEMWGKRRLIDVFTPPMQGVWNGAKPIDVLRAVERAVIDAHSEIEDDGTSRVVSAAQAAMWMAEKVQSPPDRMAGIATPFRFLPRFQPGRLYVIGGYPKDGKTASMMQFVRAAASEGKRVGIVSVEMSWEDLTTRLISSFGVPYTGLQDGFVGDPYRTAFFRALGEVSKFNIDIVDDAAITATDIMRYQRLGRYDFLLIDYLQRMPYKDRFELNDEIKKITTLARNAKIPILLLSQFSRPQGTTGFPRPTMSMFAETSVIEKEAAMAMAIWRPRDEHGNPGHEAKFMVMANRYGTPGTYDIHFDGENVRFTEVPRGVA